MSLAQYVEQGTRRLPSQQSAVIFPTTPLQTTASTILTVRAGFDLWLVHLWVANTTASAVSYTIHFVPSGGSPSTGNMAVSAKSLAGNTSELVEVAINHRLLTGESIRALCGTNNAINLGGWGYYIEGGA